MLWSHDSELTLLKNAEDVFSHTINTAEDKIATTEPHTSLRFKYFLFLRGITAHTAMPAIQLTIPAKK